MPLLKPTTLAGMTQQQIDFFAEWDPGYLQSLKAESAAQNQENKTSSALHEQEANIQSNPRPRPHSTTFEEWKAKAVLDAKKENARPLSPAKDKGPPTSSIPTGSRGSPGRKPGLNQQRGHQKRGSIGASSVTSIMSQITQFSPPKANSARNVKTNSSSMIPVLSPERDHSVACPHRGGEAHVNGGDSRVEDASASVTTSTTGQKNQIEPPQPVSSSTPSSAQMSPTPPKPATEMPATSSASACQKAQLSSPKSSGNSPPTNTQSSPVPRQSPTEAQPATVKPATKDPEEDDNPNIIANHQVDRTTEAVYKAPNGTSLTTADLARLSAGVKRQDNVTDYFRPSFVVSPWSSVNVSKTVCLERY